MNEEGPNEKLQRERESEKKKQKLVHIKAIQWIEFFSYVLCAVMEILAQKNEQQNKIKIRPLSGIFYVLRWSNGCNYFAESFQIEYLCKSVGVALFAR